MQRPVEVAIVASMPIAVTCSELDTKVGFQNHQVLETILSTYFSFQKIKFSLFDKAVHPVGGIHEENKKK